MPGRFIAEANFNPVNAIHVRITSGRTTKNLNARARQKSEMSQVITHLIGQIDALHYACTANLRVA